jgi:hypothetical protein
LTWYFGKNVVLFKLPLGRHKSRLQTTIYLAVVAGDGELARRRRDGEPLLNVPPAGPRRQAAELGDLHEAHEPAGFVAGAAGAELHLARRAGQAGPLAPESVQVTALEVVAPDLSAPRLEAPDRQRRPIGAAHRQRDAGVGAGVLPVARLDEDVVGARGTGGASGCICQEAGHQGDDGEGIHVSSYYVRMD